MRQTLDTRFARAAKAKAPRDLADARHRSLLRARSALSALLRGRSPPADTGRALTGALEFGDAAAVELAGIPDTPDLRRSDEARLARDHAGAEEEFEAQMLRLLQQHRDGRELDPCEASPAELLAACLAGPPPFPPPQAGEPPAARQGGRSGGREGLGG